MLVKSRDWYIGSALAIYGEYSEGEVDLFRSLLTPESVALDIGANMGALTVPLAKLCKQVHAFEPQQELFPLLLANCLLTNRAVSCYPFAVGSYCGLIDLPVINYDAKLVNGGGLSHDLASEPGTYLRATKILTIDSLKLQQCDFMKVDVEGMELQVLYGAMDTIKRLRPILYVEDDRKDRSAELREYIGDLKYSIHEHKPPLYNPNNFNHIDHNVYENIASHNLLCIPNEKPRPAGLEGL